MLPTLSVFLSPLVAQQPGHQKNNGYPALNVQLDCTKNGGCGTATEGKVVIDSNWMWVHPVGGYQNCYKGSSWDNSYCPDATTCAKNCALDAGSIPEYKSTYGISSEDAELTLGFVTKTQYGTNVGSRTYLMQDESNYQMFKLKNREFTFDVDVSQLPCGLNGALYFVEMDKDGGMGKFPNNNAGAAYGTGYCDAQCPHDIKFINGEANIDNWDPSGSDTGVGKYGTCCNEMDIWEANSQSTQLTPHACTVKGQTRCEGKDCGDNTDGQRNAGVCDKDGCDWNPYRLQQTNFFGEGSQFTVDTTKKMTVVTQFLTDDGTDSGTLSEIRRFYVQDGKQINSTSATLPNMGSYDSITDKYCTQKVQFFNETVSFEKRGGLAAMGESFDRGMVLVMSLWDDHAAHMLWLDSDYPPEAEGKPGFHRGPCSTSSGVPETVEQQHPTSNVKFSNIKFGEIGSTTAGSGPGPSPSGCPGGSLAACIGLCPSTPAKAYQVCVQECVTRCPSQQFE